MSGLSQLHKANPGEKKCGRAYVSLQSIIVLAVSELEKEYHQLTHPSPI